MPEFLSPEWLAALDTAARASKALTECAGDDALVLEQRVVLPDGTEAAHHVVVAPDGARVVGGPAPNPDLVLRTDLETACELALGATNAQHALAGGRLRIGGDIDTLATHGAALRALDDVFARVRISTTFPHASGRTITSDG